jgi:hypothetical protein
MRLHQVIAVNESKETERSFVTQPTTWRPSTNSTSTRAMSAPRVMDGR